MFRYKFLAQLYNLQESSVGITDMDSLINLSLFIQIWKKLRKIYKHKVCMYYLSLVYKMIQYTRMYTLSVYCTCFNRCFSCLFFSDSCCFCSCFGVNLRTFLELELHVTGESPFFLFGVVKPFSTCCNKITKLKQLRVKVN